MLGNQRPFKSRFISFLITFCLIVLFFILLNAIQTVKVTKLNNVIVETAKARLPAEYLKDIIPTPSEDGYCKLNYGLPAQLYYSKDAISGSPEFEEDSPYHTLHDVIEGRIDQDQPEVTYATHLTKEFVLYISEVVRYWEGPVSVAAYVADEDAKVILEYMLHFCYCIPEMSRVSLHLVFKKDFQLNFTATRATAPDNCDIQDLEELNPLQDSISNNDISYVIEEKRSLNNWYPINVCRNVARQASYTEYVLVCDIELMPSENLASRFLEMTGSFSCLESSCEKRVFVVPVFEVESTENIPRTKRQLLDLIESNKAVYFHQFTCSHCQKFPGLEQWKSTYPGDAITPLLETRREIPYERWEPIFIGTKNEPMYHEQLSWEGFQDKMLQMLEMCMAGYKMIILDGAFLVHWPGIKKSKHLKDDKWRRPYIRKNQRYYNKVVKGIISKYPRNLYCKKEMID